MAVVLLNAILSSPTPYYPISIYFIPSPCIADKEMIKGVLSQHRMVNGFYKKSFHGKNLLGGLLFLSNRSLPRGNCNWKQNILLSSRIELWSSN